MQEHWLDSSQTRWRQLVQEPGRLHPVRQYRQVADPLSQNQKGQGSDALPFLFRCQSDQVRTEVRLIEEPRTPLIRSMSHAPTSHAPHTATITTENHWPYTPSGENFSVAV